MEQETLTLHSGACFSCLAHVHQPVAAAVPRTASGRSAAAAESRARAGRRRGCRALRAAAAAAAAARRGRARRLRRRGRLLAPVAHGGAVLGVLVALRGACGGAARAGAAAAALPAHLRRRPPRRPAGAGAACCVPSVAQRAPHAPRAYTSVAAPGRLPCGLREARCVRGAARSWASSQAASGAEQALGLPYLNRARGALPYTDPIPRYHTLTERACGCAGRARRQRGAGRPVRGGLPARGRARGRPPRAGFQCARRAVPRLPLRLPVSLGCRHGACCACAAHAWDAGYGRVWTTPLALATGHSPALRQACVFASALYAAVTAGGPQPVSLHARSACSMAAGARDSSAPPARGLASAFASALVVTCSHEFFFIDRCIPRGGMSTANWTHCLPHSSHRHFSGPASGRSHVRAGPRKSTGMHVCAQDGSRRCGPRDPAPDLQTPERTHCRHEH